MHARMHARTELYSPGANLDPFCAHIQIPTGDKRQPRNVILLRGQPSHLTKQRVVAVKGRRRDWKTAWWRAGKCVPGNTFQECGEAARG